MRKKYGVLLLQLGTPDSPSVSDVRRYLSEFLNDARVIDIPWLLRKMLVNLIIVPFRAPKSAKVYKEVWTDNGSPLLFHSQNVEKELSKLLGDDFDVRLAMRYQNPSMDSVLAKMQKQQYEKLVILPLFPQYASATNGSAMEKALRIIQNWWVIPELSVVSQYYNEPGFIDTIIERAKKHNMDDYDHILFSYHGLPIRQVDKVYEEGLCEHRNCETEINEENRYCYKATCYATTRLIAEKLSLSSDSYTVCFQSRLDKKWLEPFADKEIIKLAKNGAKKLLVFSPAFVADCLETVVEIGTEYQEIFEEHGGEKVQLVESLNSHPMWIDTLAKMVKERV